jgi:hypothetical protein
VDKINDAFVFDNNSYKSETVPKLQFLEQQPINTAVLQPEGRKTARASYKITDFGTGSSCSSLSVQPL